MIASSLRVLPFTLLPLAAAILGGVIAAFWSPRPTVRSAIQHFTAGVVFASVAGEVLPDIERQNVIAPILGFVIGVPLVLTIRWLGRRLSTGRRANGPRGFVVTTAADLLADGFPVGVGFLIGGKTGMLLTIALTLEIFFLGLTAATALGQVGVSRSRIIAVATGLGLLFALGVVLGAALLSRAATLVQTTVLAIGLVIFLYLATEELLVEAHEVPETPWGATTFFAGFLTLLVIEMVA